MNKITTRLNNFECYVVFRCHNFSFILYSTFTFQGPLFYYSKENKTKIYGGLYLRWLVYVKFYVVFIFKHLKTNFSTKKIGNNSSVFKKTFAIQQITSQEGHIKQICQLQGVMTGILLDMTLLTSNLPDMTLLTSNFLVMILLTSNLPDS